MAIPHEKNKTRQDLRRLAAMVARMPEEAPPPGITAAVMRRIQPKQISRREKIIRRLLTPWSILPLQAVTAVAAVALIVGGLAFFKGTHTGREQPPPGITITNGGPLAVTFILDYPAARKVTLIGSFNHWNPEAHQMHRDAPEGPWRLIVKLSQGEYQYAFLIDDQQVVSDPNALWQVEDGFGNRNSALIVENGNRYTHES